MNLFKLGAAALLCSAAMAVAGPVSHFGRLVTCGGNICGEKTGSSRPVQVKGPSLFWSTGIGGGFYNEETVNWFVQNMDIGVIRAAMAIKWYERESGPISASDGNKGEGVTDFGYLSSDATGAYKKQQQALIEKVIQAAIDNDIYVLVDWHSHTADKETSEAASFFKTMATKYKDCPNIIWEIYNEPTSAVSTSTVDSYAQTVTAAIRNAGSKNLVVVGSRKWSSYPLEQSQKGLHNKYDNIAYTFHFYAAEHSLGNGNDANSAAGKVPVFVTEWGTTMANGDGRVDQSTTWTNWMDENKISSCNWFAGGDKQMSAMFVQGTTSANLSTSALSESGKVFQSYMQKNGWSTFVPSTNPFGKSVSKSVAEGSSVKFSSTDLGLRGKISSVDKPVSGTVTTDGSSITFQSASYGSPEKLAFNYFIEQNGVTVQARAFITITDQKPILKDTTFSVSNKAPTKFSLSKLGANDPVGKGVTTLSMKSATASSGKAEVIKDTLVYTPDGKNGVVKVEYEVANKNGSAKATLTLKCENQAPTIYKKTSIKSAPNTEPLLISLKKVRASDADGDSIWFKSYTRGDFPGKLELNKTGDTLIYTPESGKTGSVTILAVVTDGEKDSPVGTIVAEITGSGSSFDGKYDAPTEIPGYEIPESQSIGKVSRPMAMSLVMNNDQILFSVPNAGKVSLEVFDLRGLKVRTLVNDHVSAGMHAIVAPSEMLTHGIYVVRLRQGAQVKVLRYTRH